MVSFLCDFNFRQFPYSFNRKMISMELNFLSNFKELFPRCPKMGFIPLFKIELFTVKFSTSENAE